MEAEAYDGPSLIIAYCPLHRARHRHDPRPGRAEEGGRLRLLAALPLRPGLAAQGKNPLQLDCKAPTLPFKDYAYGENRYLSLTRTNPKEAADLLKLAEQDVKNRVSLYQQLADIKVATEGDGGEEKA